MKALLTTRVVAVGGVLLGGVLFASAGQGQAANGAPKKAPEGSTGLCKDGSYTQAADRKGACGGHKGVKAWYAETRAAKQQEASGGTNPPKSTPSTTPAASSPEPIASPAPKQ